MRNILACSFLIFASYGDLYPYEGSSEEYTHENDRELVLMGTSVKDAYEYLKLIASGQITCNEEVAQFLTRHDILNLVSRDPAFFNLFQMPEAYARPLTRCILKEIDLPVSEVTLDSLSAKQAIVLALLHEAYGNKKMPIICSCHAKHLDSTVQSVLAFDEYAYLIPPVCAKCPKREHKRKHVTDHEADGGTGSHPNIQNLLLPWIIT